MVSIRLEVPLIRVGDGEIVPAWLVTLDQRHLDDFSRLWRDRLRASSNEDQYWDWEQKKRIYLTRGIGFCEGYAIECEQIVQGLMLLQTGGYRSKVESDRKLVYVNSLATAPWNRVSNPEPSGFRAVGSAFLEFARFRSDELGYGGLVGLHSLPGSEMFYRKMGMIDGGLDPEKEELRYFEWYRPTPRLDEE
jgi:hypothetical protein